MSQGRDAPLLSIGHQCSESSCHLVDFLPIKCQHCSRSFCSEHFKVDSHNCSQYDEAKFDRVAPSCPLCNVPVAIPPDQDPNIRMERHFTTECSVMTGRAAKKSSPTCAHPRCKKILFAPISCTSCRQQFCPQHRFPKDHPCSSSSRSSVPSGSGSGSHASTNAAMAAIKRNLAARASAVTSPQAVPMRNTASSTSTATSMISNPFSKTESSPTRSLGSISSAHPSNNTDTDSADDSAKLLVDPSAFVPRPLFVSA